MAEMSQKYNLPKFLVSTSTKLIEVLLKLGKTATCPNFNSSCKRKK